jgi:hypothetical protein
MLYASDTTCGCALEPAAMIMLICAGHRCFCNMLLDMSQQLWHTPTVVAAMRRTALEPAMNIMNILLCDTMMHRESALEPRSYNYAAPRL